jgi:teichoic acid transport system ATP-binding protein
VSHDLASVNKYCDRVVLLNKGNKVKEGDPKEIIDIYKKILVNQYDENEDGEDKNGETNSDNNVPAVEDEKAEIVYKDSMEQNPNVISYGNGVADIVDFAILDNNGQITNSIESGTETTVLMKVLFHQSVDHPIFAYTIKDVLGVELVGTNTMYEHVDTGVVEAGSVREIRFKQKLCLQNGDFLLSLGCTGYENGEFVVYNRLYDVCSVSFFSDYNFVGKWNAYSKICESAGLQRAAGYNHWK